MWRDFSTHCVIFGQLILPEVYKHTELDLHEDSQGLSAWIQFAGKKRAVPEPGYGSEAFAG